MKTTKALLLLFLCIEGTPHTGDVTPVGSTTPRTPTKPVPFLLPHVQMRIPHNVIYGSILSASQFSKEQVIDRDLSKGKVLLSPLPPPPWCSSLKVHMQSRTFAQFSLIRKFGCLWFWSNQKATFNKRSFSKDDKRSQRLLDAHLNV